MKSFIVALSVIAVAAAAAVNPEQTASVLRSDFQQSPVGFEYGYETENGIFGQASGQVKSLGKDENALEVIGSNSFKSPDGNVYEVKYVANELGYQPQGAHLPTPPSPPPTPDYILRSLDWIAAHPYIEKKN